MNFPANSSDAERERGGTASLERPGLLQQAATGTVFLEEIDELSKDSQKRVLRVLEEGKVQRDGARRDERCDVRVLASTSLPWSEAKKKILPALAEHLTSTTIDLPSLADRPEDIEELVRGLLVLHGGTNGVHELPDEVLYVFERQEWTKNVDELSSHIEHACSKASGPEITIQDLPRVLGRSSRDVGPSKSSFLNLVARASLFAAHTLFTAVSLEGVSTPGRVRRELADWDITDDDPIDLELYEKKALLRALDHVNGDKLAAAKLLQVGKSTLYRKLKKLGIA